MVLTNIIGWRLRVVVEGDILSVPSTFITFNARFYSRKKKSNGKVKQSNGLTTQNQNEKRKNSITTSINLSVPTEETPHDHLRQNGTAAQHITMQKLSRDTRILHGHKGGRRIFVRDYVDYSVNGNSALRHLHYITAVLSGKDIQYVSILVKLSIRSIVFHPKESYPHRWIQ